MGVEGGWSIGARVFNQNGSPIGDTFKVNTHDLNSENKPTMALFEDGGFVVTWESNDPNAKSILGQRFDDNANSVGGEFEINTYTDGGIFGGRETNGDVAVLANGNIVSTWSGLAIPGDYSNRGISAQILDPDGNKIGGEFRVNSHTSADQTVPVVTALSGGDFVIAWLRMGYSDERGIAFQRYEADGTPVGGERVVSENFSEFHSFPKIVALDDGGFLISWSERPGYVSETPEYVKALRIDATGTAVGDIFTVAENHADGVDLRNEDVKVLNNGDLVFTWSVGDPASADTDGVGVFSRTVSLTSDVSFQAGDGTVFFAEGITVTDIDDDTLAGATVPQVLSPEPEEVL